MAATPFTEIDFYKSRLSKIEPLLALKQQQINSLLEITEAVNNNWPINALVRIFESILIAQLGIQRIALIVKADGQHWSCISYTGSEHTFIKQDMEQFLHPFMEMTVVNPVDPLQVGGFDYVIPIAHKKLPIGFAFWGDFRAGEELDTREEKLKFTQTISNIILVANENKRLFKGQMEKAIMEKELRLAADMQNMLVPSAMMNDERIQTAAFYRPHQDIGGDYYDFIQISEDEVVFCISDISGKGVPAALLMANFQANLRALVGRGYSLDVVVELLNKKVSEITKGEKFITFFLANYTFSTRQMQYVNAGHNPSVLYSHLGEQLLDKGCTILGMFDKLPFIHLGEISVPPNSLLVCYTDGLTEAANATGDLFELEGLLDFVAQHHALPLPTFNRNLIDHISAYKGNEEFDDDLTLLTLRFSA